jgi:hypothetical protein
MDASQVCAAQLIPPSCISGEKLQITVRVDFCRGAPFEFAAGDISGARENAKWKIGK